jgi:hypothetical protein
MRSISLFKAVETLWFRVVKLPIKTAKINLCSYDELTLDRSENHALSLFDLFASDMQAFSKMARG